MALCSALGLEYPVTGNFFPMRPFVTPCGMTRSLLLRSISFHFLFIFRLLVSEELPSKLAPSFDSSSLTAHASKSAALKIACAAAKSSLDWLCHVRLGAEDTLTMPDGSAPVRRDARYQTILRRVGMFTPLPEIFRKSVEPDNMMKRETMKYDKIDGRSLN